MSEKWIDTLQKGSIEIPLPELRLQKGANTYTGSGRLVWADHSSIRITGITNGSRTLFQDFGRFPLPGSLVPHDTYTYGYGTLQDGSKLEIYPVAFPSYHLFDGQEQVAWDYKSHGIKIVSDQKNYLRDDCARIVQVVLEPELDHWTRGTITTVENPVFGYKGSSLDWTQAETRLGLLALRKLEGDWIEATLRMKDLHADIEMKDIVTAIGRSIGFINGKRSRIAGYSEQTETRETKSIEVGYKSTSRNKLIQPLGFQITHRENCERLLGDCFNLFISPLGNVVEQHLFMCWDIVDNAQQSKAVVLSVCLESLIRLVHEMKCCDSAIEIPGKSTALTWLESVKDSIDAPFYKRMKGFLGSMHHMRPIDILNKWKETGFLGTSAQDIEAWSTVRNSATHGRMIASNDSGDKLQSVVSSISTINNMINKIVLFLANYAGKYSDGSRLGWPEAQFPQIQ